MARWVTRRGFRQQKEDLERLERERKAGDTLAAILFAAGLFVIVFFVAHHVDQYFGDFDQWSAIVDRADEGTALFAFLRDISLGIGQGLGLIGLSWLTARSLLRATSDDEYATVGTGQAEAARAQMTEGSAGRTTGGAGLTS
jgi:hypothetical protein